MDPFFIYLNPTIMNTDLFEGKVLVQYLRNSKRQPKGVVVAIGAGIVGWSLCSKHDTYNREHGLMIAHRRAVKARVLTTKELIEYYEKSPDSIKELIGIVGERSFVYFKKDYAPREPAELSSF